MELRNVQGTVRGVRWMPLRDVPDDRGRLTAIEGEGDIPFRIARVFYVHDVRPGFERGGHAHRDTEQVAIAVYGTLKIDVSDGVVTRTADLRHPGWGLYLPRMIWTRLYDFSPGAVCLVLASTHYDRAKSIRTWKDYLAARCLPSESEEPRGGGFIRLEREGEPS